MVLGSKSFSCIKYEGSLLPDEWNGWGEPAHLVAGGEGVARCGPSHIPSGTGFDLAPPGGDCLL